MNNIRPHSMTAREWAMLILLSTFWGGSFFFTGVAIKQVPPMTLVMLRAGIAAIALLGFMRMMNLRMPRDASLWRAFVVIGILNNMIPFSLIAFGQTQISSGLASILNATTPLWTLLIANSVTTDEKITLPRIVGIVIGITGVVCMIGMEILEGVATHVAAEIAILLAAISYACAAIYGRRFRRTGIPPLQIATGQVIVSTLILLPISLLFDRPWTLPWPTVQAIGAIFGLAIIATALAYILYFRILATAGASNLSLVTLLIPVSAILLGTFFLDERLKPEQVAGMTLIALGLIVIDGRAFRRLRKAPS